MGWRKNAGSMPFDERCVHIWNAVMSGRTALAGAVICDTPAIETIGFKILARMLSLH